LLSIIQGRSECRLFSVTAPDGSVLAWDGFLGQVHLAARQLARDGVGAGDCVVYQAPQSVQALILFWAAMLRGAVFCPLDDAWPEHLLRKVTPRLGARLVATPADRRSLYAEILPGAAHVSLDEDGWAQWLSRPAPPAPDIAVDPDAPAAYLFTSGSTGVPKTVVLSRRALAAGARLTVDQFEWRPGERLVNLPDPHTMSGLRNGLIASVAGDMRWMVFGPEARSDIFTLAEGLAAAGCERLVAGPALIRHLAQLGDRIDPEALSGVKAIYCTGAMLSPQAADQFHARFGLPIVNYYGLTETGGICISQSLSGWSPQDHSLGRAAGAELRVVTASGPSKTGTGELQVRSGQLMTEYLGDPAATAERFDGYWIRTGDEATIDPDGRCHLVGRLAGFIKTASTDRVAPEEIEEALEGHPAVAEAAVLGVEAQVEFERMAALVVLKDKDADPVTASELAAFVRHRLGAGRAPSQIHFIRRLPRGAGGKIARSQLKELLP
jgi:acyl-coenzyme A synthetase/AMP-(fatty) acid ligase